MTVEKFEKQLQAVPENLPDSAEVWAGPGSATTFAWLKT